MSSNLTKNILGPNIFRSASGRQIVLTEKNDTKNAEFQNQILEFQLYNDHKFVNFWLDIPILLLSVFFFSIHYSCYSALLFTILIIIVKCKLIALAVDNGK